MSDEVAGGCVTVRDLSAATFGGARTKTGSTSGLRVIVRCVGARAAATIRSVVRWWL